LGVEVLMIQHKRARDSELAMRADVAHGASVSRRGNACVSAEAIREKTVGPRSGSSDLHCKNGFIIRRTKLRIQQKLSDLVRKQNYLEVKEQRGGKDDGETVHLFVR
jgi:hypothetical protein